jgi:E3 ubiquitin-protein ligase HUWE1
VPNPLIIVDDEDMYEGEYDEEMEEYGEEIEEDDEDNISDEDEELAEMGEIEGLPGDHAVDVEVIMEDDDDDDDDDEDDEDTDEDDEEDSDGMDEEEGNAQIEIIGEDGQPIPMGNGDDDEDWESEEDEEEDYEERHADEEEAELHEMGVGRGAIGQLVRAFDIDDHQGAVEILQRMDDVGMDEEQMDLDDYLEEEQDQDGMSRRLFSLF